MAFLSHQIHNRCTIHRVYRGFMCCGSYRLRDPLEYISPAPPSFSPNPKKSNFLPWRQCAPLERTCIVYGELIVNFFSESRTRGWMAFSPLGSVPPPSLPPPCGRGQRARCVLRDSAIYGFFHPPKKRFFASAKQVRGLVCLSLSRGHR